MRRHLYFIFLSIFAPLLLNAQIVRTISLEYSEKDFGITETEGLVYLSTNNYNSILKNDTSIPALPYICVNVLIGPDESYIDFTSNNTEIMLREGITVAPNPPEVFANENNIVPTISLPFVYTKSNYPDLQLEYTGTHITNGYKFLTFLVCPFRYDFTNKRLYLNSRIDLNIQLNSPKNIIFPGKSLNITDQNLKDKDDFFINEEQKGILYKDTEQVTSKSNTTEDYPYKYLIITTNSMKDEFERLARWKSTKGVKAKVLTVEYIYSHDTHTNRSNQLKIKYAIKDYYEPYKRGIEYVLLGGDVNHVPVEMCYIQTTIHNEITQDTTPADLYYSSFTNMEWDTDQDGQSAEIDEVDDLTPDVAITRLPARNSLEAAHMINRIIDYEKNANTNNWNNSMLLSGVQAYDSIYVNGRIVSDAEMQTDSMFTRYIHPFWQGNVFRFYDTFTNHTQLGAGYDVTSYNLQQEFMKGYSFAVVNTHGESLSWDMETIPLYNRTNAMNLNNPHYTIFSTAACLTNAFDYNNDPCLGEAFMRNENGGALSYYGCSRKSICYSSPSDFGPNMEYLGLFYKKLFYSESNCLGEAFRNSKNAFCSNCYNYNAYRWMYLTLNLLGDPEMPVYNDIPSTIPNVSVNFNGSDLSCTSGVERPMLCLMSRFDDGNSFYYYNYGHGSQYVSDNVFHQMFGEYSFCLTKNGYLPTLAVIGNTVHLQNETLSGKNNVIAYHTLIGSNVTNQTSEGSVTIENGSTVITSHDDVIITGDFEVQLGAELEINISSQNQVAL